MDFLILRPLPPKTGYHFFRGGGVGGGGGGSKVFAEQQWGSQQLPHHCRSNGNAADAWFRVGGSIPGLLTFAAAAPLQTFSAPGFEPPTQKLAVACITIRPLLILATRMLPTAS